MRLEMLAVGVLLVFGVFDFVDWCLYWSRCLCRERAGAFWLALVELGRVGSFARLLVCMLMAKAIFEATSSWF